MAEEEEELRKWRGVRGPRMARVRDEFISEVERSPAWRVLREHLGAGERSELVCVLGTWLSVVVLAHRTTEEALRQIVADGRFKNKAEVGSPHPRRPPELERRVWTIETQDPGDLPIYGYAAPFGDLLDLEGGDKTRRSLRETYGPARVVFKNSIRERTTFTLHDSLWRLQQRAVAPSLVDKPSSLSWPNDADFNREAVDRCTADEYTEIQVLGRVYTDDVDVVLFDGDPEDETKAAFRRSYRMVRSPLSRSKLSRRVYPPVFVPQHFRGLRTRGNSHRLCSGSADDGHVATRP